MEGVREPLRTGTLLGVHNTCGSRVRFFSHAFDVHWLLASGVAVVTLFTLNRWRVYIAWPYAVTAIASGVFLHAAGVHATLAGVLLAVFLPTRPAPAVALLLGQAATALEELEHAERDSSPEDADAARIQGEPIREWAGRNLSAASERLLSPADRIEGAIAPWTTYLVLPVRCRNFVTPPRRTREPHHRDDRDAGHEPRPTPSPAATVGVSGKAD